MIRKILCMNFTPSARDIFSPLAERGWDLLETSSPVEAGELATRHQPGLGLLILTDPNFSDWYTVREVLARCDPVVWVAILPSELLQSAQTRLLIARHFSDYQTLPLDVARLSVVLGHLYGMSALHHQVREETETLNGIPWLDQGIESRALFEELRRAACMDEPVLIIGEAGTEKERAARVIHRLSSRQGRSFSMLHCGALPANLLECELFGMEGSRGERPRAARPGRLETMHGGSLFLDDLGELPISLQTRLLDLLQHRMIRRIGGSEDITVDARLIAANPHDLRAGVREGSILEDLYQRLSVLTVRLTPLRARREDIERLAAHYLRLFMRDRDRPILGFTFKAIQAMREHDWPENTQELIRRLRRAIVMCQGDMIDADDLGFTGLEAIPQAIRLQALTLEEAKSVAEKQVIMTTLKATDNNISRAARKLAISRMTLYRLLNKHQIKSDWHPGW